MSNHNVYKLSDIAAEAQAAIQRDFKNIDPIVGVMRNMRAAGFPADAMTVDCLKSGKRIIFILHDDRPDEVDYQFGFKAQDPEDEFKKIPLDQITVQQMYVWMKHYFASATHAPDTKPN